MDQFSVSCMKLLNDYPLYDYAAELEDGGKCVHVLLLGGGSRMETLLYQVLTCGQMLDTSLDITLVNSNAPAAADAFMRKAPAAGEFVRIFREYEAVTEPTAPLATLRFESGSLAPETVPGVLLARVECPYVLISTGNGMRNQELADACAKYEASRRTLVAYVQDSAPQENQSVSAQMQVQSFGPRRDASYFAETERIAFNLHYIYEKSQDGHMPVRQIEDSFREPYNYISNIEAAVHVRTKLACCGIDSSDLKSAARLFQKALQDDPSLSERLSLMEHNRWLMSKVLKGYVPMPDVDLIYSAPGIGTHDNGGKWHCCIVPCNMDGSSRIEKDDWDIPFDACRQELDPLDRMTLLIHETCKKISGKNRPNIESILRALSDSLTLDTGYSIETIECERRLETAVAQLWAEKKSAIPLFRREVKSLHERIQKEGAAQSFICQNLIELLDQAIAPLIEYVNRKDYKEQDRIMVRQIPFALLRNPRLVLVKTLSRNLSENLYSPWQFEPQRAVYMAIARSEADLVELSSMAGQISRFLARHSRDTGSELHVFVPEALTLSRPEIYCDSGVIVHTAGDLSIPALAEAVMSVSTEIGAGGFDVSGGEPLLNHAVNLCAEQLDAGVFYLHGGRLCSLLKRGEFGCPKPEKPLTVREMFDLSGAVLEESEAPRLSGMPSKYKALWKIAWETVCWDFFCKDVSAAHHAGQRRPFIFYPSPIPHPDTAQKITGSIEAMAALLPELYKLEKCGVMKGISLIHETKNLRTIGYVLAENVADPLRLEEFLKQSMAMFRTGAGFSVSWSNGYPALRTHDLFVKALTLPEDRKEAYERLLQQLEAQMFILNRRADRATGQQSFSFASREILTCLQKSGNILERLIYFSAAFDGHFDDVELGWKFLHSADSNSAENEIDVICTKGFRSLFISAKMNSAQQLTYGNTFNYILYEISLLADRFGINATPVLVAPALKQFRDNPQSGQRELSNVANLALRRGVYLIGEECIRQDLLGQTLDRIISGDKHWCDF